MMKARRFLLYWISTLSLVAIGCDRPSDTPPPEPATAATSTASSLEGYCQAMCKRTTACSLELAKRAAQPEDAALLDELAAKAPEQERLCREGCGRDPLPEGDHLQLERGEICLRRESCDALGDCLAAL